MKVLRIDGQKKAKMERTKPISQVFLALLTQFLLYFLIKMTSPFMIAILQTSIARL